MTFRHFINELLDGQKYDFWFLMENLWWPGLTFLNPPIAEELISRINYKKKGLILDTGHLLHMNHELASQEEAISYLNAVLDKNTSIIPWIRGVHLQQSLTGEYIKNFLANPPEFSKDPDVYACQCYEHIFAIDRHEPFTCRDSRTDSADSAGLRHLRIYYPQP